jgi:hypothetical protein
MKTLVTFCQKTGRRLRRYINRQIAKLSHRGGQLKISIAFSLPFLARTSSGQSRFASLIGMTFLTPYEL